MSLVSKFLSPQQLEWSNRIGLTPALEDILIGINKGFYTSTIGSQMLNDLVAKALEDNKPNYPTFDHFKNLIDEGDYLQVTGSMDYSQTGEASIFASDYKVLTKALRPLPDTMDYTNTESRYLDRVADFKMNTKDESGLAIRDIIRYKAKYWQIWREEMENEGFLEVECPVFESIPGGAEAKPFTTFYNELDQEMYLRISLELPLKKLVAGGFERVFEIGRIFRNEGSSPQHLQEYTQIEWYCAYTDYDWAAKFVKRVYQRIVEEILGKMNQVAYNGSDINWGEWCSQSEAKKMGWELINTNKDSKHSIAGWPKIPYFEAVRYFSGGKIDTENKTDQELLQMCKSNGITDVRITDGAGALMDKLWKKARVNTTNPFFLVLPPVELEPLAKRDPTNPELTQRWQVVAGGAELGKAFSELNDPIDQFGRFSKQQEARDSGNEEAQFMDVNYVKAMEYGMPPMSGFGTSERFVSFLLGKHIRECVTFPHIREQKQDSEVKNIQVVLYDDSSIPMWSKLNTASHLTASISARNRYEILGQDKVQSADGVDISLSIPHPIVIRQTTSNQKLKDLIQSAKKSGLSVSEFTIDNRDGKSQQDDIARLTAKNYDEVEFLGVAIFGDKKKTEKLTSEFVLFGENNLQGEDLALQSKMETEVERITFDQIPWQGGTILEYWQDSYKVESTAKIIELGENELGKYAILDRTIFHPQGGGQPSDVGFFQIKSSLLGDVFKALVGIVSSQQNYEVDITKCVKEDKKVLHYYDGHLEIDQEVTIKVDPQTRSQNIQLHSTAHLLDFAIAELGLSWEPDKGYSFPVGSYVQYNGEVEVTPELISSIEYKVNELRLQGLDFKISYTRDTKFKHSGSEVTRKVAIEGRNKVTNETPEQDCGGTHINNTRELSPIKIRKIQSKKGTIKASYEMDKQYF
jgi:lysyl-tRNA synthetase, class II